jgi:hypothetical protein
MDDDNGISARALPRCNIVVTMLDIQIAQVLLWRHKALYRSNSASLSHNTSASRHLIVLQNTRSR